ncbi:MAG TPA: hypothetical protein VFE50_21085 [Cyclobacteriaceae bacterium]|nr:hypothetical protein [Cyclobacteriaceae bacterium]
MKTKLITLLILASGLSALAQTPVEKSFPIQAAKELSLEFDHPDVNIQTWDKNEVLIKGTVSINNGENDSAFELRSSNDGGLLRINSLIKDKENLPRHITIKKGEQEYHFKAKDFNDPEVQKFLEENGRNYSYMSSGVLISVNLQVFVPKNFKTSVDAKFGTIEFKQFDAPLRVTAKHGKVDATVPPTIGELVVRTKHGEILSNLDVKFDEHPMDRGKRGGGPKWTEITAHPGKGQSYFIESQFGTVYLRKP